MAVFENIPYTNFHDLNLDWIISTTKDLLSRLDAIKEETEEAKDTAVAEFNAAADAKAAQTIASIPSDYSKFFADAIINMGALEDGGDVNNLARNGFWLLPAPGHTFLNSPFPEGIPGLIVNYASNTDTAVQIAYAMSTYYPAYWVRNKTLGAWSAWTLCNNFVGRGIIADNTDINTLLTPGTYFINSGHPYTNSPFASEYGATLVVFPSPITNSVIQMAVRYDFAEVKTRMALNGAFNYPWTPVGIMVKGILPDNTNLNNITESGYWLLPAPNHPFVNSPLPEGIPGILFECSINDNTAIQIAYAMSVDYTSYWIRNKTLGTWSKWEPSNPFGMRGIIPADTDINTILSPGVYFFNSTLHYTNHPYSDGYGGTLLVFPASIPGSVVQMAMCYMPSATDPVAKIRTSLNGKFNMPWTAISGGNNYTFNEYSATYNITANPSITTDTNAYLAPSGTTADRTADIVTMLSTQGVCRLGKGDYYVKNLQMPSNTMLTGAGPATRIILAADGEYAIKIGDASQISNIAVYGSLTNIELTEPIGSRHGLLWQGTYTQDQQAPRNARVTDVYIRNFSGGAITCYDTGYGTHNALQVENVDIVICGAGINISYWSEFNKFTNVKTYITRYGCVNNGGNNVFVNCDFSNANTCFMMDNANNQNPNNGHGSAIGCLFNHSGASNNGTGILINNCVNGFMFIGCQVFYSKITLINASGVVLDGCNIGLDNCDVSVSGGGAVLFSDCMVQGAVPITVTNNPATHFANCYVRDTGAVWSN